MTGKNLDLSVLLGILDALPASIFVKDSNLKFVYSNHMHCKMIGKNQDELIGFSDADFYPESDAAEFAARDRQVLFSGIESVSEEMARQENGMTMPVLTRKARFESADGAVYLIGTNSNLTDIRHREHQYKALSETVPVGVAQIDENLEISFSNPLFNAYCGGDGTEADSARLIEKLQSCNASFPAQPCRFEAEVQGLGNQPCAMIVISSGWIELGDAKRSATISLIDISQMTELKRINNEISRLNSELAENMRKLSKAQDSLVKRGRMEQLGQLTATVAHELRNPLGAVRTSAFLLQRKLKDKGLGIEGQIERINNGIVRCDNIITQLLDFSRTSQLQCQPSDLDSWLTQVVEEEVKKLPATVEVELALGLDGATVPFDPARLQRAVINMVSNAVEAMTAGQAAPVPFNPRLCISTYMKAGFVSVRVVDNGPGIPHEVIDRIREPLFTTKSFGTGLGVPAIEQIAAQHGGRLDIKSKVGEGSSFTVWLPIQHAAADQAEKAA
jgi:PAS domain S-box-containing protein